MKVLFLDIDGVMIVKQSTVRRTNGGKGISDTKLKMLKQIVEGISYKNAKEYFDF